jgi:hypothetical protein
VQKRGEIEEEKVWEGKERQQRKLRRKEGNESEDKML